MRNPREEARRWLDQARYDLDTARYNAEGERYAPACFWAQQAAEKAAKAYLYGRGDRLVLGHSVAELLARARESDEDFSSLEEEGAFLDRFYIPTRYPNGLPGGIPASAFRKKDAIEAIETAGKIVEFSAGKLGGL